MLSRASSTILRRAVTRPAVTRPAVFSSRSMVTVNEALTAEDARSVSGYASIDYTINENSTVYDAVQKFAAFNIGALVVTDDSGKVDVDNLFLNEIWTWNRADFMRLLCYIVKKRKKNQYPNIDHF